MRASQILAEPLVRFWCPQSVPESCRMGWGRTAEEDGEDHEAE